MMIFYSHQQAHPKFKHFLFRLFFFAFLFFGNIASATTYYFSDSGNDSYTAAEAADPSTPWRSISKLNAIFPSLKPGDSVLLKRGDRFFGTIRVTRSGSASAPIVIGAYGSGDKPIVTGFVQLSDWESLGGGMYKASNDQLGVRINMLTVNGTPRALGRFPNIDAENSGYLTIEATEPNAIIDEELDGSPNWTGAELVLRTSHWTLDKVKISHHSGKQLRFEQSTTYKPKVNFGYFIQNDVRTLDQFGEWAYNAAAQKVTMYFGANNPADYKVRASVLQDVIFLYNQDYIVLDNLAIEGANENGIDLYATTKTRIQNCDILNSGVNGIWASNTNGVVVENCSLINSNSIGIFLSNNTNNNVIRGNRIRNSGVWAGMGQNGANTDLGVRANGSNNLIEYNEIDRSGYCGIRFTGNNVVIKNNLITKFGLVKDDAGGIYTGSADETENFGRKITNNIILDGIGAKEGTDAKVVQQVSGIYLDNNTSGIDISGNTIARCGKVGIYVHNAFKIKLTNNTCYDNTSQIVVNHDKATVALVRDITMKNNIYFSKRPNQVVAHYYTRIDDINRFGNIDNNFYFRPLDENVTFRVITGLYTDVQKIKWCSFDQWKAMYDHDAYSKKSHVKFESTANPDEYIEFVYNASESAKTFNLPGTYTDVRGKKYIGSIALKPYTSAVLMKISSDKGEKNTLPTVEITSPEAKRFAGPAAVRITADAADEDGSIEKVEFYEGDKLIKTEYYTPYTWTWNDVEPGKYTLTAKAYDNEGNIATSAPVSFKVDMPNEAPEVSIFTPLDNATFTAPASVRIRATASDKDGTIEKVEFYHGSKLLDIEYEAPYGMMYRGLEPGTYEVVTKAYDNDGAVTISAPITFRVVAPEENKTSSVAGNNANTFTLDETNAVQASGSNAPTMNEASAEEVGLYPNPAVDRVYITLSNVNRNEKAQITINNAAGGIVKSMDATLQNNVVDIDVSTLTPGAYFITITTSKMKASKMFLKK